MQDGRHYLGGKTDRRTKQLWWIMHQTDCTLTRRIVAEDRRIKKHPWNRKWSEQHQNRTEVTSLTPAHASSTRSIPGHSCKLSANWADQGGLALKFGRLPVLLQQSLHFVALSCTFIDKSSLFTLKIKINNLKYAEQEAQATSNLSLNF